jgi:hypothetical protein
VLQLIPEYLAELIHITTDSRNVQEKSVKGFHFLVNSFWPVVAESLLDRNVHHPESLLRSTDTMDMITVNKEDRSSIAVVGMGSILSSPCKLIKPEPLPVLRILIRDPVPF